MSSLHSIRSAYTSIQIQNNIVQQKYNIHRTCQMLNINIERVGTNSRLIMTRVYKVLIYNYITYKFL